MSNSTNTLAALLPLVAPEEQQRILDYLYKRVTTAKPGTTEAREIYQVARLCAEYGYLRAYDQLFERITTHPEQYSCAVSVYGSEAPKELINLGKHLAIMGDAQRFSTWSDLMTRLLSASTVDWEVGRLMYNVKQAPLPDNPSPVARELKKVSLSTLEEGKPFIEPDKLNKRGLNYLGSNFTLIDSSLELATPCLKNLLALRKKMREELDSLPKSSQQNWQGLIDQINNKITPFLSLFDSFLSRLQFENEWALSLEDHGKEKQNEVIQWINRSMHYNSWSNILQRLESAPSFNIVLKILEKVPPIPFYGEAFVWTIQHYPQHASQIIQTWNQWYARSKKLSALFDNTGYTPWTKPSTISEIPLVYRSLPTPPSFEASPDGLKMAVEFAEACLRSDNAQLQEKGRAILTPILNQQPQVYWAPENLYVGGYSYCLLPSCTTSISLARACYLDGQFNKALDLLSNTDEVPHTISEAKERFELLFNLAGEFNQRGLVQDQQKCEQAAYNYHQALEAFYTTGPLWVGNIADGKQREDWNDSIIQFNRNAYHEARARYKARVGKTEARLEDASVEELLVMAKVHSEQLSAVSSQLSANSDLLIRTAQRITEKVRARETEADAWGWLTAFKNDRSSSFVGIVLDSTLDATKKDELLLGYAKACLGEEEGDIGGIDMVSLSRNAEDIYPLLKGIREGECPQTEAFVLGRLDGILDKLQATYPHVAHAAVNALAPLVNGLEKDHPELLNPDKKEDYQALDSNNSRLARSVESLYPDLARIGDEMTKLADEFYGEARKKGGGVDKRGSSTFTRLSLETLCGLEGFGKLGENPLSILANDPVLLRKVCLGIPTDRVRAQVLNAILREVYTTTQNEKVKAVCMEGFFEGGYLRAYAKKVYEEGGEKREELTKLLQKVVPFFKAPIPDRLIAWYFGKDKQRIVQLLDNPKVGDIFSYYNNQGESGIIYFGVIGEAQYDQTIKANSSMALLAWSLFDHTEQYAKKFDEHIRESAEAIKTQLDVEIFLATADMPQALENLPPTLQFVCSVYFFQNPALFGQFRAYCREGERGRGETIRALFQMAHAEKLAQALANWPGLLDDDLKAELAQCQENNSPVSQEVFEAELTRQLGHDWREDFSEIDWSTRKVGSVAEVVKAKRMVRQAHHVPMTEHPEPVEGWVAIKLLIPTRVEKIKKHLEQTRKLFVTLSYYQDEKFAGVDLQGFAEEYITSYEKELDLRNEAVNAAKVATAVVDTPVHLPTYYPLSQSSGLLLMSWEEGMTLNGQLKANPAEAQKALDALWGMAVSLVFRNRLVLDDLHPGNLRWDQNHGRLIAWDFGRLTGVSEFDLNNLRQYATALFLQSTNAEALLGALRQIARPDFINYNAHALLARVEREIATNNYQQLSIFQKAQRLVEVVGRSGEDSSGMIIRSEFTMVIKMLLTLENVSQSLLPSYDPIPSLVTALVP